MDVGPHHYHHGQVGVEWIPAAGKFSSITYSTLEIGSLGHGASTFQKMLTAAWNSSSHHFSRWFKGHVCGQENGARYGLGMRLLIPVRQSQIQRQGSELIALQDAPTPQLS